jgi:serine/threonine protein kinase
MAEKRGLCADVGQGLYALHQAGIVHGDVKIENALVFRCNLASRGVVAKLSDFGASVFALPDIPDFPYSGTPLLNAPEIRQNTSSTSAGDQSEEDLKAGYKRCDIFSLGLLVWEVLLDGRRYIDEPGLGIMASTDRDYLTFLNSLPKNSFAGKASESLASLQSRQHSDESRDLSILCSTVPPCLLDDPLQRPSIEDICQELADSVSRQ